MTMPPQKLYVVSNCQTCRYWEPVRYAVRPEDRVDRDAQPGSWGNCTLIGDTSGQYREDADRERSHRAFTQDSSKYRSWLLTRSDFGCIDYWAKP